MPVGVYGVSLSHSTLRDEQSCSLPATSLEAANGDSTGNLFGGRMNDLPAIWNG